MTAQPPTRSHVPYVRNPALDRFYLGARKILTVALAADDGEMDDAAALAEIDRVVETLRQPARSSG